MLSLLTKEKKAEIRSKIINKAWQKLNTYLNHGLDWEDARAHCLELALSEKQDYDNQFEEDPDDVEKSRLIWEMRMDQFELYISCLQAIPI